MDKYRRFRFCGIFKASRNSHGKTHDIPYPACSNYSAWHNRSMVLATASQKLLLQVTAGVFLTNMGFENAIKS